MTRSFSKSDFDRLVRKYGKDCGPAFGISASLALFGTVVVYGS